MTAIQDRKIADALIDYGVDLARYQAGLRKKVLGQIAKMERELVAHLISNEVERATLAGTERILKGAKEIVEANYDDLATMTNGAMQSVVQVEVSAVMRALEETRKALEAPLPKALDKLSDRLLVLGSPSKEWWAKQSAGMQFEFGRAVRQGRANGETIQQIVKRIKGSSTEPGVMGLSRSSATRLTRDLVASTSNQARLETLQENRDILGGMRQLSTLDSKTSEVCIAYSGAEWDMDYEPINGNDLPFDGGCPRHHNCRSVIVPITLRQMRGEGFRTSQRAAEGGPVRSTITFEEWLNSKSESFQDKTLGVGKAQLWREGKITLRDLLDNEGNALTLQELRDKYA